MRPAWRAALVVRASPAAAAAVAAEPWSSGLPPRPAEAFPGWTPKPPWTGAWSVTAAAADATAAGKASQTTAVVVSAELGSKLGIPARAPARHQLRSRLHLRVPRRHYPFTPPSPSSSPPCGPVPTFSASNPTLTPPRAQRRPLGVPVSAPPLLCSLGPFRPPTHPRRLPQPPSCREPPFLFWQTHPPPQACRTHCGKPLPRQSCCPPPLTSPPPHAASPTAPAPPPRCAKTSASPDPARRLPLHRVRSSVSSQQRPVTAPGVPGPPTAAAMVGSRAAQPLFRRCL